MKKLGLIAMALALVVGLTQCKKETDSDAETNGVFITLNVSNGSRVVVNPTGHTSPDYATVTWEDGDILYVGNNGAYCGYLTYDGSKFAGTITPTGADDADYLHFYFMGNKGTTSEPTSVSITDQTSKYPVIMYGHSEELYSSGTTSYTATLKNKCAIVKFTTTNIDADITILGMNNTVTVDFTANNGATTGEPYSFGKSGDGEITLHAESNTERWAILLPQAAVTTATATATGYATETAFTVPAITANMYHNSGISVELSATSSVPVGAISGKFTINASGDQVYFSQGNLQYQASTSTWQFAEYQYDRIGNANLGISETYDGWIDLFGWGTSGYDNTPNDAYAVNYQPWSVDYDDVNADFNANGYGPSTNMPDPNLVGTSASYDWGVYNAISNGGNQNGLWRTLTNDEWSYLIANHTKGKSTVNGISGWVLRPYGVITDVATSYTAEDWVAEEAAGSVFLPTTGFRGYNASVDNLEVNNQGFYWSSTHYDSYQSYNLQFWGNDIDMQSGGDRCYGFAVRLVCPAE